MYIADFEEYRFGIPFPLPNVRAIGWLDADHDYQKGASVGVFVERLWQLIETRNSQFDLHANVVRGIHPCNFCGEDICRMRSDGKRTMLGMSELWVPFQHRWFAAPTLIVHYVEQHEYQPPQDFVSAVLDVDKHSQINAQEAFEKMCAPLMQ